MTALRNLTKDAGAILVAALSLSMLIWGRDIIAFLRDVAGWLA